MSASAADRNRCTGQPIEDKWISVFIHNKVSGYLRTYGLDISGNASPMSDAITSFPPSGRVSGDIKRCNNHVES